MVEDLPSIEYVCDFIYLDRPRIAAYYAQLNVDGVLTQVKRTRQLSESSEHKARVGVPGTGGELGSTENQGKTLERNFDAAWLLPLDVINRLDALGFIGRGLNSVAMGQMVLLSGTLRLVDIRMLRDMWQPMVASMLPRPPSSAKGKHNQAKSIETELAKILVALPHALQMSFFSGEQELWSTLSPDHMVGNPDDIAFKHGSGIAGEFSLLGIIDARPDADPPPRPASPRELDNGMFQVLDITREMLGRPRMAFGVTPIAIFRTLRPNTARPPTPQ